MDIQLNQPRYLNLSFGLSIEHISEFPELISLNGRLCLAAGLLRLPEASYNIAVRMHLCALHEDPE